MFVTAPAAEEQGAQENPYDNSARESNVESINERDDLVYTANTGLAKSIAPKRKSIDSFNERESQATRLSG